MSAQEQMRAMLDELMGTSRDGENKLGVKFTDPRVCRAHLLNSCPHDILAGTRMDIGDCSKLHDVALRADYEQAVKSHDYSYDIDAMEHLSSFIADCDRRTEIAKKKLAETQQELSSEADFKAENVHKYVEEIGKKLAEVEKLGEEGKVEESIKAMAEVEELKKMKLQAEEDYRNSMPASSYQQQKLRVCEVCSAYLGLQDNDRRLADHFGGKLHLGFIEIREKLQNLKISVSEKRDSREQERTRRREEREKERVKERDRDGREVREREGRERRHRRSRSPRDKRSRRSRSKERRRSRERDRGDRERERGDRERGDRDRDREKSRRHRSRSPRERRRRSRSRSREKKRHSWSKDRQRSSKDRGRGQQEAQEEVAPPAAEAATSWGTEEGEEAENGEIKD